MQPKTTSETTPANDSVQPNATTTPAPACTPEPAAEKKDDTPPAAKGNPAKPKAAKKPARAKGTQKKGSTQEKPTKDETKPEPTTKAPDPDAPLTLEQLAKLYVKSLEKAGKSPTTQISYAQDLLLAIEIFGANEPAEHITGPRIKVFNGSDLVMKTKTGRAKAKPTVLKTRRVLRQALTWAAEQGLIAKAPEFDRDAEKKVWA